MRTQKLTASADFDRFWSVYPRRVARLDALKAWHQLSPSHEQVDQILAALAWQVHQPAWVRDGGQFVPYPGSWIRAGRWYDEPFDTRSLTTARAECQHEPRCSTTWAHGKLLEAEGTGDLELVASVRRLYGGGR